jgi:glycosyltransferase involved in cell wall biosynthesis
MATPERRVTVVIPTRNRRGLLQRTLDSVLRQENVDVTVIVVDDGGTDGTTDLVRNLRRTDVRAIRHEQSRGVSAARNRGLREVSAPWVAFIDDDDLWAPGKLAAQLDALATYPDARWSCVSALHVDSDLSVHHLAPAPPSGSVAQEVVHRAVIPGGGSGVLVETALARAIGGFDEAMSIVADWDFYLRLGLRSPLAAVESPLMAYYIHSDSMYHNPRGVLRELLHMEKKYSSASDGRFSFDRGEWYVGLAGMAQRLGDRRLAGRILLDGVRSLKGISVVKELSAVALRRMRRRSVAEQLPDNLPASWLDRYRDWTD